MAKPRSMVGPTQIPQRCEGGVGRDPGALVTFERGDERAPGGGPRFRRRGGKCRPGMEWAGGIAPGLGEGGREWIPGCHVAIAQRQREPLGLVAKAGEGVARRPVERREELLVGHPFRPGLERCRHLVSRQGPVIRPGLVDLTGQWGIDVGEPLTEEESGAAGLERPERPLREGPAIRHAVAVDADRMVSRINNRHMDERPRSGRLLRPPRILRAVEEVTPRQPMARLDLAKDDRIEEPTLGNVEPDHTPAALIEIGKRHPGLECLLCQIARQRLRAHVRPDSVEDQPAIADDRAPQKFAVETTDAVARVSGKAPPRERGRKRNAARLAAAALEGPGPGRPFDRLDRQADVSEVLPQNHAARPP